MNRTVRLDPPPEGVTTLDLLLFTAGFACGWVMHQGSALRAGAFYNLPFSRGGYHSLLGTSWAIWIWAGVTGLAFLVVGRRFRYDCRNRVAEWLAVGLSIVLLESVYPAFRTKQVGSMTGEIAWFAVPAAISPAGGTRAYELWWPRDGVTWEERLSVALQLTFAAALVGIAVWRFRKSVGPAPIAVAGMLIAGLLALGPGRLAEGTSIEVTSSALHQWFQPNPGEKAWAWPAVAAYYDARAWAGYSLRALALLTLAMLVGHDFVRRRREWLWTEWTVVFFAAFIAGCWLYDELYTRPALDRTVRVVFLCTWLGTIAVVASSLAWVCATLITRFRRAAVAASVARGSAEPAHHATVE